MKCTHLNNMAAILEVCLSHAGTRMACNKGCDRCVY